MVDVSQTPANVRAGSNAATQIATAGEALDAGDSVYLGISDGEYYKTDANDASKYAGKGLALTGATADGDSFVLQTGGESNIGGTTVIGIIYVASANAGKIAPAVDLTTGWYTHIIGIGKDTIGTLDLILKHADTPMA